MRSRAWLCVALVAAAAQISPMLEPISAQSGPGIVISEFRFRGPAGVNDEFIELHNAGDTAINIGGWLLRASNNNVFPSTATRVTMAAGTSIAPGCFYLIVNNNAAGGFSGGVLGDRTYTTSFAEEGGVAIMANLATPIDQAGIGANSAYFEGTRLPAQVNAGASFQRLPGGDAGHADTNDNATDFAETAPITPRNSQSPCLTQSVTPHDVQGPGAQSPLAGTTVNARGVVTARVAGGFFIQSQVGDEDADPATSEGLFVAMNGAAAQVGSLVQVRGAVVELASRTQVNAASVIDLGPATLPAAYELTAGDLSDTGSLDQLERFEGMRVTAASLTAVSGSTLDAAFFAVLTGQARPFREAGVVAGSPAPCAIGPCNVPVFDGNPERLRVDSDAVEGTTAVHLSSGAAMSGVSGPLDFSTGAYTLLPDASLNPVGGTLPLATPPAAANQYSIANLHARLYDAADDTDSNDEVLSADEYETQLVKASLMVRTALNLPDVVAIDGAENAAVLHDLSTRIDVEESAAGNPAPAYTAVHVDHPNQDGLDVAFLVKSGRVTPLLVEQAGADETIEHPTLVLQVQIQGPATSLPQVVTVVANHLPPAANAVARQARAESLANYLQGRQINDPREAIVSVGGYGGHGFNDGVVDVVGTVRGVPAAPDQVALASPDVVSPDLLDAADALPAKERYSLVVDGNAQSFDHVLFSANLSAQFAGYAHARVSGDFPQVLKDDGSTPAMLSPRDPASVYFTFPPDVDAPVFVAAADETAEATSAAGAVVNFARPEATDNLDPTVVVACTPESGSTFALGNTGVSCSAQDAAGNTASVEFTVSVVDTTAPAIAVPGDLVDEAKSSAGAMVTFAVSATDAVTASVVVSCSPASGSVFAIGATTVQCAATDAAGNGAAASFTVTVTQPVFGRMAGVGHVVSGDDQLWFAFDVRESANYVERGTLMLIAKDQGRPDRFLGAGVTDVRFSNSDGYSPGVIPRRGVDTVVFTGRGWWNGQPGYHFQVTASDRGEPGPGNDTFTLVVRSPDGQMVESVSGVLRDGNIQSLVR